MASGCAAYFAGHNVVVLADNDEGGRQHAERKAALIAPTAASVRVLHFPELAEKADVSDWIAAGHSADDLRERADAAPVWLPTEFVSAPITPLAGRHLISHRAPATYNRSGCNGSGRVASPAERLLFLVALQG